MTARAVRFISIFLAAAVLSVGLSVIQPAQTAQALSGSDFNAGDIIDDANFYNGNAMSQADIQSFLQAKEGTCGNSNCLQRLTAQTSAKARIVSSSTGNLRCGAFAGGDMELASQIIFKVQQACGVSARVILVTLQKEEALVTATAPSSSAVSHAMGYACPDTAPCATASLSFFEQVYQGVLQLNTYKAAKFGKQPGTQTIAYSPTASCGSKTFVISNYATAALYNYTPYTPNAGALANLYGTAPCGAYGNRNFWVYYNNWFGSPTGNGNPQGSFQTATAANDSLTVTGWAADPDVLSGSTSVRVSGTGWSSVVTANVQNTASLTVFPGGGTSHGFSATLTVPNGVQQVCVNALNQGMGTDASLGCKSVSVPTSVAVVSRVAGNDRFDTAVKLSQATFPTPGIAVAYVASGDNFPDALSIVPIAAANHAPLLLVSGSSVQPEVLAELNRLKPQKIVVVGGESAITPSVVASLSTVAGLQSTPSGPNVSRVQGIDRYQTSIAAGQTLYSSSTPATTVYVAVGSNYPDAISAASAAGHGRSPLLLIDGSATTVSATDAAALHGWGVQKIVVVGGTSAISDQLKASLNAIAPATRISGADRYETSAAVNAFAFPAAQNAYIATGANYSDGLTGGAIAGAKGQPMLLAPGTCVPATMIRQIVSWNTSSLTLIGGASALGPAVENLTPC